MRLGDLLVRAGQVSAEDVDRALARMNEHGGRLGDNLVAMGLIDQPTLESYLHRIPAEPADIRATGLDEGELVTLLMKLIYTGGLENVRQYMDAICLPYHIVSELVQMAIDRRLLITLGTRGSDNLLEMSYIMTEEGRSSTVDALERLRYTGPAPVRLDAFIEQVNLQKPTSEVITVERVHRALGELEIEEALVEKVGPALNSGRAILLYGPPGNGKTTVALRLAAVFEDVIYVPYAVEVEGQIIRVFDGSVHQSVAPALPVDNDGLSFVRKDKYDTRWVPCRRPFLVAGGELTLEMLDLRYETSGNYYQAPLHMKALGGCFLIDDFGRQLVSPGTLLNRWIVPLESRVDYLKLHTGKSFSIPFEELVIFSTNLDPEDLMDPAFLRRLPYKIEVGGPDLGRFRRIFAQESKRWGMTLDDATFQHVVSRICDEKQLELAAYQPRFLIDQVVATCRFLSQPPHFEPRYLDYAIDNLRVRGARSLAKPAS
jgi:DNA polymerase III delta prime subunit